jgi:hypothetical protein
MSKSDSDTTLDTQILGPPTVFIGELLLHEKGGELSPQSCTARLTITLLDDNCRNWKGDTCQVARCDARSALRSKLGDNTSSSLSIISLPPVAVRQSNEATLTQVTCYALRKPYIVPKPIHTERYQGSFVIVPRRTSARTARPSSAAHG